MPDYRRAWHPGGTCFFTVNLLKRHGNDLLTRPIAVLRETVRVVRKRYPFLIHGGGYCRTTCIAWSNYRPKMPILRHAGAWYKWDFPSGCRAPNACPRVAHPPRWTGHPLGTPDSGRGWLPGAQGLRAYQSGETRLCRMGIRLAVFDIPPSGCRRRLSAGLGGWRGGWVVTWRL